MFQETFFKNLSFTGALFALIGAGASLACGAGLFGLGVLTGAAWIFLNSYFLFRLVQIGFEPKARVSDKILLFSILKFPVLYVAGYFILKSRVFPVMGVLTGLTLFMAAFVLCWIKANLAPKVEVRG